MEENTAPTVLICGCQKYRPFLEAAVKRFTRAKHTATWRVIGVIGDETRDVPIYTPDTHILTLPVPDTYEALPRKLWVAFQYVSVAWPATIGIFKTDDDIVFDYDVLAQTIARNTHELYWGHIVEKCRAGVIERDRIESRFSDVAERTYRYPAARYCHGIGYWLDRHAIDTILMAKEEFAVAPIEDVFVGAVLNRARIYPMPIPLAGCEERTRDDKLLALE